MSYSNVQEAFFILRVSHILSFRSSFTVTPGSEQIRATITRDKLVREYTQHDFIQDFELEGEDL